MSTSPAGGAFLPGDGPWSCAGGRTGVVVVHNFTAGPPVVRAIAECLAAAGHTLEVPLLRGHGGPPEAIVPFGFSHFRHDVQEAAERARAHSDWLVLVGAGAGGTCALQLAAERDDVAGVAVVSAPTGPLDARLVGRARRLLAEGHDLSRSAPDEAVAAGAGPRLPARMPLRPYLSLHEAAGALALHEIDCPILGFYDLADATLVDAEAHTTRLRQEIRAHVEIVRLIDSGHFATVGPAGRTIAERILAFVDARQSDLIPTRQPSGDD
jgi:carboxylesterase